MWRARFGRYAEDGSSSILGSSIHIHNPLGIPLQLHLSGVPRGAEIETGTDKRMEGTTGSMTELEQRFPSAEKIARGIIAGIERGNFAICDDDSMESGVLFANMIGPSPKRGLGLIDSLLATVVGLFVWPVLRRRWDSMCKQDGIRNKTVVNEAVRESNSDT